VSSNQSHAIAPVVTLLLGAAMWGVIWYPMRLLEAAGLSGLWLSLLIYAAALGVSLPVTARRWREGLAYPGILGGLALTAGWTNIAFILAIIDGNVMRVLLLFYLSPLWAVLMGWSFLGERISGLSLATLLLAMVGALMMLWNPELGLPWPREAADWLALTSGMAFAASNVLVRKGQAISLAAKVGYTWTGVTVLAVILILLQHQPLPVLGPATLAGALGLGIGGILAMTVLVQYGVTRMPVHRSAVILLFELVAGAVSQQLLTHEVMSWWEWAGGALIIAAAYVSARA